MNAAKTSQQIPQAGASSLSTSGYKNLVPTQAPSTTASSTTTSNINPQQRQRTDGRPSTAVSGQYPSSNKPTIGSLTEENVRSQQRQMHQESVPYLNPVARIDNNQTKARVLHPVQRPSSTSSASQQQQQIHPVPVNSKTTGSSGTDNSNFAYQRIPKHPTSTSGVAPNNVDYNRGTTSSASSSTSLTVQQQQQQPNSQNKVKAWQQQQHSSTTQKPPPFNQPTHNSSSSSNSSRNNSQPAPPYNDPKSGQPKQQQQPNDFWFNENSGRSNEPTKLETPPKQQQQIKTSSIFSPSPERDTDHSNFKRSGSNNSSGNKSGVPANNWSENKSTTDSPKEKYQKDRRSSTPNKRDSSSKRSDVSTTPTSQKSRSDRKPTVGSSVKSENSNILNTSLLSNSASIFDSSINSNVQQKRPFGAVETESSDFRDHKIRKLDTKDTGSLNSSMMDNKSGIKTTNSYDMSFGMKEDHNESLIPLKSTNSKETNPEFVKSLLAETCGVNKFENSMDSLLTVAGLDCDLLKLEPPEQLLAAQSSLSLFHTQQPAFNTLTENTPSSLHTSEDGNNSSQEHQKRSKSKKKKDKHKHKDRSKDKEERKKHKKDKERHKDRDSDRAAKDSMSLNNSDRSLKIRIPISKELTPVTNVSGMSGSANQLNTSITTQQPLKLKISKNHMENYNTSNPTINSQPMTESTGYSTSATATPVVPVVVAKPKEKKDKSREKDRRVDKEKDRQRSSVKPSKHSNNNNNITEFKAPDNATVTASVGFGGMSMAQNNMVPQFNQQNINMQQQQQHSMSINKVSV